MESNKKDLSVAEAAREMLDKKPFLRELMDMDAVNYRGLARYFEEGVKEKTGKEKVNLDSIVMAIRRYEEESPASERMMEKIESVLEESELFMIGDMVYYTLPRKKTYHDLAVELYDQIEERSGERIYLLQSDSEIGIVTNKGNSRIIDQKVEKKDLKNLEADLAMVVIDSPNEILEADGILSYLTEKAIMNGIGVVEMFSTYTETVFLVKEEDSTQLYSVFRDLIG